MNPKHLSLIAINLSRYQNMRSICATRQTPSYKYAITVPLLAQHTRGASSYKKVL